MPSKQEKLRRKKLIKTIKIDESELPISFQNLAELLNYLDEQFKINACDDTPFMTINYLKSKNLDYETIIPWLKEYGGYCDCEVLANVEDAWSNEIEDYI